MPANVSALTKKAEPGAELTCRAHEKEFSERGTAVRRSVISYYASATLASAKDLSTWLDGIEQMSQADLATGVITQFYQPAMQMIGDTTIPLPGRVQSDLP